MDDYRLTRRSLLKGAGALAALAATGGIPVDLFASERMARFSEKTDLQLLTARPVFSGNSAALLQGNDYSELSCLRTMAYFTDTDVG